MPRSAPDAIHADDDSYLDVDGESDHVGTAAPAQAVDIDWSDRGPASDPVRLTLDIIRKELRRPEHPRLVELDEDLWWLREQRDLAAAKQPLSERLEWGIFSLLSTSGGISRPSFDERVGHLFRGPETADADLVEACLESYRSRVPSEDGLIRTDESLQHRYAEHGEMVGLLTDFAHRVGMRAWITKREQRRRYGDGLLGDLLSDPEQRVYLPLVAPGPQEVLEEIDCIWYVRGKGAFLFDVEWQAVLDEPVLNRGPRIETNDNIVRFLVVPDERTHLLRLRLERSPILRRRLEMDNWHILKWSNVRRLHASPRADLSVLSPLLGLDPEVERGEDQMPCSPRERALAPDPAGGTSCPSLIPVTPVHAFAERAWEQFLELNPLWATMQGDERWDDRLDDPGPDGRAALLAMVEGWEAEMQGFDGPRALGRGRRHPGPRTLRRGTLQAGRTSLRLWEMEAIDQYGGPQGLIGDLARLQRIDTPERFDKLLARLAAYPDWMAAHRANVAEGVATGRTAAAARRGALPDPDASHGRDTGAAVAHRARQRRAR